MNAETALALVAVGVGAGIAGSAVGAAGLVVMTALLAMGVPPATANASTIVALIPGGVSGLFGYRSHLPRDRQLLTLVTMAVIGGAMLGSLLLLTIPASWFANIVPIIVLAASGCLVAQPLLARRRTRSPTSSPTTDPSATGTTHALSGPAARPPAPTVPRRLIAAAAASGLYGGWLSVSLGTVIISLIGAAQPGTGVHQLNALRLWLSLAIGTTAAAILVAGGLASWSIIAPVGFGTLAGGWIGAVAGRRLNPMILRALIVVSGMASVLISLSS